MTKTFALLVAAALASVALAGCAPGGGAREAAAAYLDALSHRDAAAAIALTTSPASDFACAEAETSIGGETIGEVVESGTTATAEVSYHVGEDEISETLDLVRGDDGWRVNLSDSLTVYVPVPPNVVITAFVDEYLYDDACEIEAVDGVFQFLTLPGSYSVTLRDPSGIFSWFTTGRVVTPLQDTVEFTEQFPGPNEMETAANYLAVDITRAIDDCVASHFTGDTCPEGIPAGDESQSVDRPWELVRGEPRATDIYSPDGEAWHFTTTKGTMLIQVDGVVTDVTFDYRGTLALDEDGQLVAVFD